MFLRFSQNLARIMLNSKDVTRIIFFFKIIALIRTEVFINLQSQHVFYMKFNEKFTVFCANKRNIIARYQNNKISEYRNKTVINYKWLKYFVFNRKPLTLAEKTSMYCYCCVTYEKTVV